MLDSGLYRQVDAEMDGQSGPGQKRSRSYFSVDNSSVSRRRVGRQTAVGVGCFVRRRVRRNQWPNAGTTVTRNDQLRPEGNEANGQLENEHSDASAKQREAAFWRSG